MSYGAWCHSRHHRAGIVSNQDLKHYDQARALSSVSVCDRPECIAKAIKHVAGNSNETAAYYPDGVEA